MEEEGNIAELQLAFSGPIVLQYASRMLSLINNSDGSTIADIEISEDNIIGENLNIVSIDLSDINITEHSFSIELARHFVRMNVEPWAVEAVPAGEVSFENGEYVGSTVVGGGDVDTEPDADAPDTAEPNDAIDFETLENPQAGIEGVAAVSEENGDSFLYIKLSGPASLAYSTLEIEIASPDGGTIYGSLTISEDTIVGENSDVLAFNLSALDIPDGSFSVLAARHFIRMNAAPWGAEALEPGDLVIEGFIEQEENDAAFKLDVSTDYMALEIPEYETSVSEIAPLPVDRELVTFSSAESGFDWM